MNIYKMESRSEYYAKVAKQLCAMARYYASVGDTEKQDDILDGAIETHVLYNETKGEDQIATWYAQHNRDI